MKSKTKGFLVVETIVSITVLAMILSAFALFLARARSYGDYCLARRRCTRAAAAQLDCITATASPLDKQTSSSLWRGVDTEIRITDGAGPWNGLKLVTVKARTACHDRTITVKLSRYVPNVEY